YPNPVVGLLFVIGIYVCILLHEFGHALAARWCDGEANDILLWPLGGLAFVRPAWHPTAHLITTVAGPFVTLVLWISLGLTAWGLEHLAVVPVALVMLLETLSGFNLLILLFNLIPAFPMDGGRILRDTLWHFTSAETATRIAIWASRLIALLAVVFVFSPHNFWSYLGLSLGLPTVVAMIPNMFVGDYFFLIFPAFIFMQTLHEQQIVAMESHGAYGFSIRERLRRGRKQREFRQAVRVQIHAEEVAAFHRCDTCGVTELTAPTMDFRVCPDCSNGQEYCREHLDVHPHG
ncbi:MAG: site-2 protease family protein, partial [Verrucomicrobiota bacterium]